MDSMHIGNSDISIKEYKGQRVVTFKDIDMAHGRPEGTARKSFWRNQEHFVQNKDYFVLNTDEAKELFEIVAPNGLALITERGYLLLVKPFTDKLSWEVQNQLVDSYFRVRQVVDERLSPETKMLYQMINQIAQSELQAKEAKELAQKAVKSVENIKEAVQPVFDNWRDTINQKFNRIQKSADKPFMELRSEMYQLLEQRASCDLNARLRGKRKRMNESGCTKTAINKVNKLDIIEEDKKLKEIFGKIVSEYEIKYCA